MLTAFSLSFHPFIVRRCVVGVSQGEIVKLLSLVSFLFLPCGKTFALSLMLSHVYDVLAMLFLYFLSWGRLEWRNMLLLPLASLPFVKTLFTDKPFGFELGIATNFTR
jgi:hypothetical protein